MVMPLKDMSSGGP